MTDDRLAALIAEYRPALRGYLRARGVGDEAEDLLQEIWLRAESVDFDSIVEPRAYLYRIAHNLMLDRLREQRRRAAREQLFHDLQGISAEQGRRNDAEQTLIAREHLGWIEQALANLGAKTDTIFRRHRIDRVPQRQLAEEFGVSLSAIEKQLQKAYRAVAAAERDYQERIVRTGGNEDERG